MEDYDYDFRKFVLFSLFVVMVLLGVLTWREGLAAAAADEANAYCVELGYDQYKDFKMSGFFKVSAVGVRCEYIRECEEG